MDEVIEDIPEIKMESISSASDESVNEDDVENVLDEADEIVEEVVEEAKKPSKIEELAKKTFDEINAKVDNLKNKNNMYMFISIKFMTKLISSVSKKQNDENKQIFRSKQHRYKHTLV